MLRLMRGRACCRPRNSDDYHNEVTGEHRYGLWRLRAHRSAPQASRRGLVPAPPQREDSDEDDDDESVSSSDTASQESFERTRLEKKKSFLFEATQVKFNELTAQHMRPVDSSLSDAQI